MPVINPNAWNSFENGTFEAPSSIIFYPNANWNVSSWNNEDILELSATAFQGTQSLRVRSTTFATSPGISATTRNIIDVFPRNNAVQGNSYRFVGKIYGQIANFQAGDSFKLYATYAGADVLVKEISQANFNSWQDFDITFLASSSPAANFNAITFYIRYNDFLRQNGLPSRRVEFYLDAVTLEESTPAIDPFTATFSKTDVTAAGANDGTITLTITGGSGNFSYLWNDAAVTKNRTDLPAGFYTVTITDNETAQEETLEIQINEPQLEPSDLEPYFEVPKNQSITFVVPAVIDNCTVFETLDNTLFCEQEHSYYNGLHYYQKFNQCDFFNVQFRSNLPNHECKLFKESDNSEVSTYTPELKVQLVGTIENFNVRLQDHGDNKTRVYFTGESTIPILVASGDQFEITNNADGFNGTYTILTIETDLVIGQQYLTINKTYGIASPSSNAIAKFINNVVDFNIWEFPVNFAAIPEGRYYMKITASDLQGFSVYAQSEPIQIKQHHRDTKFIEWTNIDNADDIDYTNNITHRIRVRANMFNRLPSSDDVSLRDTGNTLIILSSKPKRGIKIDFFDLPPYMHEKISLGLKRDIVRVQGIDIRCEDGLEEPQYRVRYGLSNSTAIVEQKQWFQTYNTDDLGGVDIPAGGFIIANNGFIKR